MNGGYLRFTLVGASIRVGIKDSIRILEIHSKFFNLSWKKEDFNRSETESEIRFRNILASFNIKITELSIGVKISYE